MARATLLALLRSTKTQNRVAAFNASRAHGSKYQENIASTILCVSRMSHLSTLSYPFRNKTRHILARYERVIVCEPALLDVSASGRVKAYAAIVSSGDPGKWTGFHKYEWVTCVCAPHHSNNAAICSPPTSERTRGRPAT